MSYNFTRLKMFLQDRGIRNIEEGSWEDGQQFLKFFIDTATLNRVPVFFMLHRSGNILDFRVHNLGYVNPTDEYEKSRVLKLINKLNFECRFINLTLDEEYGEIFTDYSAMVDTSYDFGYFYQVFINSLKVYDSDINRAFRAEGLV